MATFRVSVSVLFIEESSSRATNIAVINQSRAAIKIPTVAVHLRPLKKDILIPWLGRTLSERETGVRPVIAMPIAAPTTNVINRSSAPLADQSLGNVSATACQGP